MKEFDLNGVIVSNDDAWIYDWFEMDYTSPAKVKSFLSDAAGDDVVININSSGGDLYSGVNIHDMIQSYSGDVEIHVSGIAASAASVIAMAGKCLMSPASVMMIHNTACQDYGNKRNKINTAGVLGVHDKAVALLYSEKTGKDLTEITRLMDKETYLDAQTALDNGFIDGILTADIAPRIVNALGSTMIPRSAIEKIRNLKARKKDEGESEGVPIEQLKKRLELLRR